VGLAIAHCSWAHGKEHAMAEQSLHPSKELSPETAAYLAHRLDGARDLYLLALALGDRPDGPSLFGRMIARPASTSRR
jgi:hypothetical protein